MALFEHSACRKDTFLTDDAAYEAIGAQQLQLGFLTSKGRTSGRSKYGFNICVDVRCQNSGTYKASSNNKGRYKSSTKKTDCPFLVKIRWNSSIARYETHTLSEIHNHAPIQEPLGQARLRRLTQERFGAARLRILVKDLSKNSSMTAREIARQITSEYPQVKMNDEDVYHIRHKLRLENRGPHASTQPPESRRNVPVADGTKPKKKRPTLRDLQQKIDHLEAAFAALQQQLPLPLPPQS
ncbi:hypothetical protein SEPCBS57363_004372 [Sporothrix epigloea]|uniref:FAR1 domain-containing protein n=1 Tax=Sporothrix epigloea TaxID=1892477 RepID=A0ABP0DRP0_9PEZI